MFENEVRFKTGSRWSFPMAVVVVMAVLALLVLASSVKGGVKTVRQKEKIYLPIELKQLPAKQPATVEQNRAGISKASEQPWVVVSKPTKVFRAPSRIPAQVAEINDRDLGAPEVAYGHTDNPGSGKPGDRGCPAEVCGNVVNVSPPPVTEAKPEPKAEPSEPVRVRRGGEVMAAQLVRQPKPVYPQLAKASRVSGLVRLTAVIRRDGTISELRLVSGHALLVPAAIDAVKQWVYRPTLLNGEAVEVVTQIDVHFTLL